MKIDLETIRERNFCIDPNYKVNRQLKYDDRSIDVQSGTVWQPNVYQYASSLASKLHLNSIIDFGCGSGDKLSVFEGKFSVTGFDFGSNLKICQQKFPQFEFRQHDFESEDDFPIPRDLGSQSLLICADVIEHLIDPSILLGKLRTLLEVAPILLLSTPDRSKVDVPPLGPPLNPRHIREWTLSELEDLARAFGFQILDSGNTLTNDQEPYWRTSLLVLAGEGFPEGKKIPANSRYCSKNTLRPWVNTQIYRIAKKGRMAASKLSTDSSKTGD